MKIYIIGSINMDLVIQSSKYPKVGETITGNNFIQNPGGKGANQAVAVSKLGSNAIMVGCVGDAFGDELINTLNNYNVNTKNVNKINNVSSGVAIITVVNGDNSIIIDSGANNYLTKEQIDIAFSDASINDIVISQLEISSDIIEYSFIKAKKLGLITILNPAPAKELSKNIFDNTDYLILNETETLFYTGLNPINCDIFDVKNKFNKLGIKNIIITIGEKGSIGIIDNEIIKVNANKVNVVDTTAAGDTYIGAFASMLLNGNNIKDSMKLASLASSLTCTKLGAQKAIPTINEIKFNIINK